MVIYTSGQHCACLASLLSHQGGATYSLLARNNKRADCLKLGLNPTARHQTFYRRPVHVLCHCTRESYTKTLHFIAVGVLYISALLCYRIQLIAATHIHHAPETTQAVGHLLGPGRRLGRAPLSTGPRFPCTTMTVGEAADYSRQCEGDN